MDTEASGEAERFRALYEANHERVHRLLGRIANPQEADDLTQIVFAKAARALPQFRGEAKASTWLYQIATHVASDWLRSRAAHEAKATVPLPEVPDAEVGQGITAVAPNLQPSPEQALVRKDMRDCIRGEIAQLSEGNQAVLILGELGGLADAEVAQALGISLVNVKVRLHRARAQLKKAIQARCDFYRTELSCAPSTPTCCPPATEEAGAKTDR